MNRNRKARVRETHRRPTTRRYLSNETSSTTAAADEDLLTIRARFRLFTVSATSSPAGRTLRPCSSRGRRSAEYDRRERVTFPQRALEIWRRGVSGTGRRPVSAWTINLFGTTRLVYLYGTRIVQISAPNRNLPSGSTRRNARKWKIDFWKMENWKPSGSSLLIGYAGFLYVYYFDVFARCFGLDQNAQHELFVHNCTIERVFRVRFYVTKYSFRFFFLLFHTIDNGNNFVGLKRKNVTFANQKFPVFVDLLLIWVPSNCLPESLTFIPFESSPASTVRWELSRRNAEIHFGLSSILRDVVTTRRFGRP